MSSVKPSDDTKQKQQTNKKKQKKEKNKRKSIKFHKLFVLKYIFSVSDPQLFYWVESLGREGFKKNNVAFPYVSGNTFYGNLSDCLWTNPLLDIDKFFSSRDILYKNTSDVLLDVTDFNKSY